MVSPPYDMIRGGARDEFACRSPHNVVHLTLAGPIGGDWHEEAGDRFRSWLAEGVLRRDPGPAYYYYEHRFKRRGVEYRRLGFVGILRLEDAVGGGVHPHERTFEKPVLDRLSLMRSCRANLEPVFLIYKDPALETRRILDGIQPEEPLEIRDADGSLHRFGAIRDQAAIQSLSDVLNQKRLLVADGHHRFAVSVRYRDDMWASSGKRDPEAPYNFRLTYVTAIEDPGLVILPTHRAVSVPAKERLAEFYVRLDERFDRRLVPGGVDEAIEILADPWGKGPKTAVYRDGKAEMLTEKDAADSGSAGDADVEAMRASLPAAVLQDRILDPLLGIAKEKIADHVQFFRSPSEVKALVDSGKVDFGFFLRPVEPGLVWNLAARGGIMPQKSTDFYPKILSGLVFYGH